MRTDSLNAVGNGKSFQAIAVDERTFPNTRYAIGDRQVRKLGAAIECIASDDLNAAVRGNNACIAAEDQCFAFFFNYAIAFSAIYGVSFINRNAFQPVAAVERFFSDARYAVRYRYACQAVAAAERTVTDARYTVTYCHIYQAIAVTERIIADARYAIRDCHISAGALIAEQYTINYSKISEAFKPRCSTERTVTNICNAVRDYYACQAAALEESILADARYTIFNYNRFYCIRTIIPWRIVLIITHFTCAGDGQCIVFQLPCQIIAAAATGGNNILVNYQRSRSGIA